MLDNLEVSPNFGQPGLLLDEPTHSVPQICKGKQVQVERLGI